MEVGQREKLVPKKFLLPKKQGQTRNMDSCAVLPIETNEMLNFSVGHGGRQSF